MRTTIVISKNLNLVTKTLSQSRKQIKKYAFGRKISQIEMKLRRTQISMFWVSSLSLKKKIIWTGVHGYWGYIYTHGGHCSKFDVLGLWKIVGP